MHTISLGFLISTNIEPKIKLMTFLESEKNQLSASMFFFSDHGQSIKSTIWAYTCYTVCFSMVRISRFYRSGLIRKIDWNAESRFFTELKNIFSLILGSIFVEIKDPKRKSYASNLYLASLFNWDSFCSHEDLAFLGLSIFCQYKAWSYLSLYHSSQMIRFIEWMDRFLRFYKWVGNHKCSRESGYSRVE